MKRFLLGGIILILIVIIWQEVEASSIESSQQQIEEMLNIAEENDFQLDKWEVVVRENLLIENVDEFIQGLGGFEIGKTQIDGVTKYRGDRHSSANIVESLLIVRTSEKEYQVIYKISSSDYSEEVKKTYLRKLDEMTEKLFTENAQYFTCLEAVKNGMIDIVCLIEKIAETLNLTIYDQLKDNKFQTWTGYTPKWEQSISIDDNEINTHIAVTKGSNNQSTLIIGTPILITEY